MNRILIEEYQPKAVIFVGIGEVQRIAGTFSLERKGALIKTYKSKKSGEEYEVTPVKNYRDACRPWFFTGHWTASFGMSKCQREDLRGYIHEHL